MRRHPHPLWLAACVTGLHCAIAAPPAEARPLLAQTAVEKASPFAAAKDAGAEAAEAGAAAVTDPLKELHGTRAAGTKKNSPFAAAKESDEVADDALRADRSRLWWLLLPVGLAAISYGALKSQEGDGDA
jgi:hypothetical protein